METQIYNFSIYKSPVGKLVIISDGKKLCTVSFIKNTKRMEKIFAKLVNKEDRVITKTRLQLTQYFEGRRKNFNIPYRLPGTNFQIKAWESLKSIKYNNTISYKEQAKKIGNINAVRAIGSANGKNPLCIILPCHRVIKSNSALAGYAGGIKAKNYLLKLEEKYSK